MNKSCGLASVFSVVFLRPSGKHNTTNIL